MVVMARGEIEKRKYILKLESSVMGKSALNIFSDTGCAALIRAIYTILTSCPIAEQEICL